MRRLLMISPHFPPDSSAAVHRVRVLAPYLAAHGWSPTVLTLEPAAYEGGLDPELERLVPASLPVVRAHAWPGRVTRRVGVGDLGLRGFAGLRRAAIALCRDGHADCVFITIYPTYPAMLGPMLKSRFGTPFVLDYQDPWVGAWGRDVGGGADGGPDVRSRLSRRLAQLLEPRVLSAADGVTAVSSRTYEDALARTRCRPRATAEIPIGFDAGDWQALEGRPGSPLVPTGDGLVHLSYVGTLQPMGGDVLRDLLAGVRLFERRDPATAGRLRLHFIGTSNQPGGTRDAVMPYAREYGLADRVDEHPARVAYLDALSVLRQSAAILLLGSTEPHYTPSKAFPALLAGRPILAMYHEASPIVDIVRRALPAAHVITYAQRPAAGERAAAVADALAAIAGGTASPVTVDRAVLDAWSAPTLAGRLAAVCDAVAA